jgi:hypothetical protein
MSTIKNYFLLMVIAFLVPACVSTPGSTPGGKAEPAWVSDPYAVYNKAFSLAAVGYGSGRDNAEKAALANLTAIFGQSVTAETKTSYSYSQALAASSSGWSEKSDIAQAVKTSVAMDTLIGAEIKDVWKSLDGTWYAAAVMDRAKTSMVYSELIEQNLKTISALTNLNVAERQSFEGIINYYQAADLADANQVFARVRNVISPGAMAGEKLKTGDDYRLEAVQIARNIPIAVTVDGDRQNRIKGAFSSVLTKAGFRTGGSGSRYAITANLFMEEVKYPNTPYRWIRYVLDANLIDTSTEMVVFPYNINDREGHASLSEAETRAVQAAEKRINAEYLDAMGGFLTKNSKK